MAEVGKEVRGAAEGSDGEGKVSREGKPKPLARPVWHTVGGLRSSTARGGVGQPVRDATRRGAAMVGSDPRAE